MGRFRDEPLLSLVSSSSVESKEEAELSCSSLSESEATCTLLYLFEVPGPFLAFALLYFGVRSTFGRNPYLWSGI